MFIISTTNYLNLFENEIIFSFSNSLVSLINILVFYFLGRLVHFEFNNDDDGLLIITPNYIKCSVFNEAKFKRIIFLTIIRIQ